MDPDRQDNSKSNKPENNQKTQFLSDMTQNKSTPASSLGEKQQFTQQNNQPLQPQSSIGQPTSMNGDLGTKMSGRSTQNPQQNPTSNLPPQPQPTQDNKNSVNSFSNNSMQNTNTNINPNLNRNSNNSMGGVKFESGPALEGNASEPKHTPQELPPLENNRSRNSGRGFSLGFLNPFKLLRRVKRLIFVGCLFIILAIVAIIAVLVFRPDFAWNPIKDFLNNGYEPPANELEIESSSDFVNEFLQDSENTSEEVTLILTENQAVSLFEKQFQTGTKGIDIEENLLRVYLDADVESEKPLWLILDVVEDENESLMIENMGFGRFGVPDALVSNLGDIVFRGLNIAQGEFSQGSSANSLSFLLNQNSDVNAQVTDITFAQDQLEIDFIIESQETN